MASGAKANVPLPRDSSHVDFGCTFGPFEVGCLLVDVCCGWGSMAKAAMLQGLQTVTVDNSPAVRQYIERTLPENKHLNIDLGDLKFWCPEWRLNQVPLHIHFGLRSDMASSCLL